LIQRLTAAAAPTEPLIACSELKFCSNLTSGEIVLLNHLPLRSVCLPCFRDTTQNWCFQIVATYSNDFVAIASALGGSDCPHLNHGSPCQMLLEVSESNTLLDGGIRASELHTRKPRIASWGVLEVIAPSSSERFHSLQECGYTRPTQYWRLKASWTIGGPISPVPHKSYFHATSQIKWSAFQANLLLPLLYSSPPR